MPSKFRAQALACALFAFAGCSGVSGAGSATPQANASAAFADGAPVANAKGNHSLLYIGGLQGVLTYPAGVNNPMPIGEINVPFVQAQEITSIATDSEGALYVGTQVGDGGEFDGSVFVYPPGSKRPSYRIPAEVTALTVDRGGSLYVCCFLDVATGVRFIYVYPRGSEHASRTIPIQAVSALAVAVGRVNGIAIDGSRNIFLAASASNGADAGGHVFELRAGKGPAVQLSLGGVYSPGDVKFDQHGDMFVVDVCEPNGCTGQRIDAYKAGRNKPYLQILQNSVDEITFDRSGNLYAADAADGELPATLGYHAGQVAAFAVISVGASEFLPYAIAAYPPVFPR